MKRIQSDSLPSASRSFYQALLTSVSNVYGNTNSDDINYSSCAILKA